MQFRTDADRNMIATATKPEIKLAERTLLMLGPLVRVEGLCPRAKDASEALSDVLDFLNGTLDPFAAKDNGPGGDQD